MASRRQKIKFVSIKLPACGMAYPLDAFGCRKLPDYTPEYLKRHAVKLHNVLLNKVPGTLYSELVKCIKFEENHTGNNSKKEKQKNNSRGEA